MVTAIMWPHFTEMMRSSCLVCALVVGLASPAMAGPWVRDLGDFYLKLSGDLFRGNAAFNQGVSMDAAFQSSSLSVYRALSVYHIPALYRGP